MNCQQAEKLFSPHFDGELDPRASLAFEKHVDECAPCRNSLATFEGLFGAVRLVPAIQNNAPVPMPAGSEAFRHAARPRIGVKTAAAAIILCFFVGKFAYDLGTRQGDEGREAPRQNVASLYPSKPAGQRVRRFYDQSRDFARLVDVASSNPRQSSVDVLRDVVKRVPVVDDAQKLRRLDERSLGGYVEPVHDIAEDVIAMMGDISVVLERGGQPSRCLDVVRRRVMHSRFVDRLQSIQPLAYRFDPAPMRSLLVREGMPNNQLNLSDAASFYVTGDKRRAISTIERIAVNDEFTRMLQWLAQWEVNPFGRHALPREINLPRSFFTGPRKQVIWGGGPGLQIRIESGGRRIEMPRRRGDRKRL